MISRGRNHERFLLSSETKLVGKYLEAAPFGRGRAMRQTPSDMRRIGQARPLRIKGGECKCVVYACVLYRRGWPDTRGFGI